MIRLSLLLAALVVSTSCIVVGPDGQSERLDGFDADNDGFFDLEAGGRDCDDTSADINPAAEELCDGIDNDCDGGVDEQLTEILFVDADGDGFGDTNTPELVCPGTEGFTERAGDCDDADALVNPEANELCDDIDNDCDGFADDSITAIWYADLDGDGFGAGSPFENCEGGDNLVADNSDCNDGDDDIYPGADELCDGKDNNCGGDIDEGVASAFFLDSDGDGYGDPDEPSETCAAQQFYVEDNTDCDDSDISINPGQVELACDGLDNNCAGGIDEGGDVQYPDDDGDGFGDPTRPTTDCDSATGDLVFDATDCNDQDDTVFPGAPELCDEIDNDCDELTAPDEGAPADYTYFLDDDGDGFGVATSTDACAQPAGYATTDGDCDDDDDTVFPGAAEQCDSKDTDCNGVVDDLGDNGREDECSPP